MVHRQCNDGTDSYAIVVQIRRYCHYRLSCLQRCISFESYIKPQPLWSKSLFLIVVYLLNPTSNHNSMLTRKDKIVLYIFWILHQTTTLSRFRTGRMKLYIFWILHQTTTLYLLYIYSLSCISFESYIKPQLSRNTGNTTRSCISFESYIKPQPAVQFNHRWAGCISFESYIKPQLAPITPLPAAVVYLLNPTSNHNASFSLTLDSALYIFWILHQTTTGDASGSNHLQLYIFWILHQTTTGSQNTYRWHRCISFESYIKPQRGRGCGGPRSVVYLLNPTSNHNRKSKHLPMAPLYIFWILHQTTTFWHDWRINSVVYLLNPTSNHNLMRELRMMKWLYIFWILHQTTTCRPSDSSAWCCISFESYIKPQPSIVLVRIASCCISFESYIKPQQAFFLAVSCQVVYLLNPTSNHNCVDSLLLLLALYIFWILHQTTT